MIPSKFIRFFSLLLFMIASPAFSQNTPGAEVEMADKLRENGMIYIVVGVLLIVIIGLLIYLIGVDRKVSKLEKELNQGK